jgi:hypothetical protein
MLASWPKRCATAWATISGRSHFERPVSHQEVHVDVETNWPARTRAYAASAGQIVRPLPSGRKTLNTVRSAPGWRTRRVRVAVCVRAASEDLRGRREGASRARPNPPDLAAADDPAAAVHEFIAVAEDVLRREQGQWGQLVSELHPHATAVESP